MMEEVPFLVQNYNVKCDFGAGLLFIPSRQH